ncbi:hypothetical protein E6R60_26950 [Streptomyces sp. A0642]|uniref:hypothetical protein n=1 Tax=Streptomyces sp. A0642 TaxID=2563100 RepID=UPI0010A26401|nr:hypothetical protein [Streptomyces sp. A0642]THA72570.1 hypothetical protein E6R60_26950 [Streptomyces sp. A0642]
MSGTTPRLGLKTWDQTDPFLRQDFNDNSARLDASPAPFLCTSGSRPAWGPNQAGMRIYETDTRRETVWTGTAWRETLSAPPVWSGYVAPNVGMGHTTHVYYKLATFVVNRPGALLVNLAVEVAIQSIYTMNLHFRTQIDGVDSMMGDGGSYIRVEQVQTSGGGWQRSYMVPAMGIRSVGVGSHNFGVHVWTDAGGVTQAGSARLVSARGSALLVNSQDT